nr:DUF1942 domain-containing protein [Mycolicibacterium poriferae]
MEATATNTAVAGTVQPIVSDLNARARNGDTYRTLFLVATPQGVNPAALAQGQQTSGKIYFDVTGAQPDSVVYNDGGRDLAVWLTRRPHRQPAAGGRLPGNPQCQLASARYRSRPGGGPAGSRNAHDARTRQRGHTTDPGSVGTPCPPAARELPADRRRRSPGGTPAPAGSPSVTTTPTSAQEPRCRPRPPHPPPPPLPRRPRRPRRPRVAPAPPAPEVAPAAGAGTPAAPVTTTPVPMPDRSEDAVAHLFGVVGDALQRADRRLTRRTSPPAAAASRHRRRSPQPAPRRSGCPPGGRCGWRR